MTERRILIKNGLVVTPVKPGSEKVGKPRRADVRIAHGVITEVDDQLPANGETIIDAKDLIVSPGFIDIHTHLRDLNQAAKETIETGSRAAAAGGYTTVIAMANTDPTTDSPKILSLVLQKIAQHAAIRVLPLAAVTLGLKGEQLTEMAQLAEMGAVAFSDDGMPLTNLRLMSHALQFAKLLNKTIISHPEDHALSRQGCIHESAVSTKLGLQGIPSVSESACIAREIEVARAVGGRLHFAHVSAAESVELIRRAKADGLSITAEVSPHHLSLCDEDIRGFNTNFKMNPPLRGRGDQNALVEGLKKGVFDAIATDHAPHTRQEKSQSFATAPFGIIGLETAFSIVYERLVKDGHLSLSELIYLLTVGPAAVIGLEEPWIKQGCRADIVLLAPDDEWLYRAADGKSKSNNSPYEGRMLAGRIVATIANGRVVYQGNSLAMTR